MGGKAWMESGALKLKQIRLGGQAVIPVALVWILTKAVKRAAMQAPWENPNTALSQRVSGPPHTWQDRLVIAHIERSLL